MTFLPESGQRYDMPPVFGPSPVPNKTVVEDARVLALSFTTDKSIAEPLVPAFFTVPEDPLVTISHVHYPEVDYLGGRGYNEIVCSISAIATEGGKTLQAAFAPILWVNEVGALMAGREYMGLAKLSGVIPDLALSGDGARYNFSEYDAYLMSAQTGPLTTLGQDVIDKLNSRAEEVRTFGWKYIPSPELGADVSYPLVNVMRWRYQKAWSGTGDIRFFAVDKKAAPFSHQIIKRLAELPVKGDIRAFMGQGTATIDREATRRLDIRVTTGP